jgi:hypothetical protein
MARSMTTASAITEQNKSGIITSPPLTIMSTKVNMSSSKDAIEHLMQRHDPCHFASL